MDMVIMAGGLGKRLRPLTNNKPKALVELKGKPLISYQIDKAIDYGIDNIIVVCYHMAGSIQKYLIENYPFVKYVTEDRPLGTFGGVLLAKDMIDDFVLTNCDVISDISYKGLSNSNKDITIAGVGFNYQIPFGTIDSKTMSIKEKEIIKRTISSGVYYIKRSVLGKYQLGERIDVPYIINDKRNKVGLYEHNGYWWDVGTLQQLNFLEEEM